MHGPEDSRDLEAHPPSSSEDEILGLDGHWRIERKLGKGGMGTVYLAQDVELQRPVAIKVLALQYCDDPGLVQRFEREARLMAKLEHPNLVPVYSVGRASRGPYIVMKFLEGMTLSEVLKARGRLPLGEVLLVTRQVAAGLQLIHDRQIVHRDVKPANIFIGPDGHVTLLDLGVARDSESELTTTGALIGTPRYMAPEQFRGESADYLSDLYALATVVFEMLTGRRMVEANTDRSIIRAHLYEAPPDPSQFVETPSGMTEVLLKALAKEPRDRFESVAEFAEALQAACHVDETKQAPLTRFDAMSVTIPPRRSTTGLVRAAGKPTKGAGPRVTPSWGTSAVAPKAPAGLRRMVLWLILGLLVCASGAGTYLLASRSSGPTLRDPVVLGKGKRTPPVGGPTSLPVLSSTTASSASPLSTEAEPDADQREGADTPPASVAEAQLDDEAGRAETGAPQPPKRTRRTKHATKSVGLRGSAASELASSVEASALVRCIVTSNKVGLRAYIEVDGMRQGATPMTLKLEPGRHRLEFIREGLKTESRELTLASGDNVDLVVEMGH